MLYLVLDFQNLYSTECMVFQRMQKPQQWCKYLKSISRLHYPYKACDKLFARTVINPFTLQPIPKKACLSSVYYVHASPWRCIFYKQFFSIYFRISAIPQVSETKKSIFFLYLISSLPLWTLIIILVMNFFILHKEQFVQYYKLTNAQPFKYIYKS